MEKIVFCLIGVEYTSMNTPGNVHVLGVFYDVNLALKARDKKYKNISFVDIIESKVDTINEDAEERSLNIN